MRVVAFADLFSLFLPFVGDSGPGGAHMGLEELSCYVPGFRDSLNLRDFSGWRGEGGRPIRSGLIYRSARLCDLTPGESARLGQLGLRAILDLRSADEAAALPDPKVDGARMLHVDARRRVATAGPPGAMTLEDLVLDKAAASVELAFGSEAIGTALSLLRAGEVPLLVHCNSGKDRTGVAAMVMLMALGASDETMVTDYLLSNAYRVAEIAWSRRQIPDFARLPERQQGLLTIMQGVIPLVAQAVLSAIDARYPSREDYLATEYGLDAGHLDALRRRYLR